MSDLRLGSLTVEDQGSGPAVLMVHGLGGTSNSFQTLVGALEGYRVLRPDLAGAGRSARRPGRPGLDGLLAALDDVLRAARVDRAHLVGHSMGTLLCQHLAARRPSRATSLCLFGPILEPPRAAREALAERAREARASGMAGIADAVVQGSIAPRSRATSPAAAAFVRESLMRQDPAGYAAHCEALAAARPADPAAIACPTLLVAGDADPVAPPDAARALAARIAGARVEVLSEVGHWMMVEAPERSAELLRDHLAAVSQRQPRAASGV